MAIALGTVAQTNFSAATTSFAATLPSGTTTSTLLLAILSVEDDSQPTTITAPSTGPAWTLINAGSAGTTTSAVRQAWYWRAGTASEPSTQTWTIGPVGYRGNISILPLTGADTSSPTDAALTFVTSGSTGGTTLIHPGVTTTTDNAWIVTAASVDATTSAWTVPSGYTTDATGSGRSSKVAHILKTPAGASGTLTWTQAGTDLARLAGAMAIKPASAGATYTGSGAVTAPATVSSTATATAPTYTGSGAATASASVSASGTASAPGTYTASASVTAPALASASGTFTPPTYTGSGAATAPATTSGAGTFSPPTYTASASATAPATASGAGTFSTPGTTLKWLWTGAPTNDGAVITVKTVAASSNVKIRSSTASNFATFTDTSAASTTASGSHNYVKFTLTGLSSGTHYYYRAIVDGTVDTTTGEFTTAASQWSGLIGFSSCALSDTTTTAFANVAAASTYFFQCGDIHYDDLRIGSTLTTIDQFHTGFDHSVGVATQNALYRTHNTLYQPSDHDGGYNDKDGTNTTVVTAHTTAYAAAVPHPGLPTSGTLNWSHVIGRIRVIALDVHNAASSMTATDNSSKTKLGAAQKTWFKNELLAAKAASQAIILINPAPWVGTGTNDDKWWSYSTERRELSDFIQTNGLMRRIVMVSGDMHALAYDNGTNTNYATTATVTGFPLFHASPMDNAVSVKGGPYSGGTWPASGSTTEHQYGVLSITDSGGATISVTGTLYKTDNTAFTAQAVTLTAIDTVTGTASVSAQAASVTSTGTTGIPGAVGSATAQAATSTITASGTMTAPTYSGTASVQASTSVTSSASFTKPTYSGTASVQASATVSSTATATPPTYSGSASAQASTITVLGPATFTLPTYSGNASASAPASASSAGTFTAPVYTGSGAAAAAATVSASGTASAPGVITGTASGHAATATTSSAGTFTAPTYAGSGSAQAQAATTSASGTMTPPAFVGAGVVAALAVTVTSSGTTSIPTYSGAAAAQAQAATSSSVGTFTDQDRAVGTASVSAQVTGASAGTFTLPIYTGVASVQASAATVTAYETPPSVAPPILLTLYARSGDLTLLPRSATLTIEGSR